MLCSLVEALLTFRKGWSKSKQQGECAILKEDLKSNILPQIYQVWLRFGRSHVCISTRKLNILIKTLLCCRSFSLGQSAGETYMSWCGNTSFYKSEFSVNNFLQPTISILTNISGKSLIFQIDYCHYANIHATPRTQNPKMYVSHRQKLYFRYSFQIVWGGGNKKRQPHKLF
jgi:hypothetical protein